jgi:hypothetical protein
MSLNFHATHWGKVMIFLVENIHHFAINILEEEDIITNSLFS